MSSADRPSADRVLAALRLWVAERDLPQNELARMLDISADALSRYLSGQRRNLRPATIDHLVERLPKRLFREREEVKGPRDIPRVFVSSTYLDNAKRRQRVIEAIERAECFPVAMERWTADEREIRIACLGQVETADVFVGIVSWRYGWIPPGEKKSITELEYDAAEQAQLDKLMFVIDGRLDVNIERDFDPDVDRWKKQEDLARFKRRIDAENMAVPFTDDDLALKVLDALNRWKARRRGSATPEPASLPAVEHEPKLEDYLSIVAGEHGHVTLAGFETRLRVPLMLDELFVPLDVTHEPGRLEEARDERLPDDVDPEAESRREATLADAIAELAPAGGGHGIVLLGHPGAGKTTQLRRVALQLASLGPEEAGLPEDTVPVFLPLRELEAEDCSLADFVERRTGARDRGLGEPFGKWLWEDCKLLLLVDGLDEVALERRREVREWVQRAAHNVNGHRVVVSCRFDGYHDIEPFGTGFTTLALRSLDAPRIEALVHRWYRAVETTTARQRGANDGELSRVEKQAEVDARDLLERLRKKRATRVWEFASNPLLLTAICLVHRDRGKLPDRRAELYDECVNGLLQLWREQKRLPIAFDASQARRVLQPLALWLHEQEGRTRATSRELIPVLDKALRREGGEGITAESFLATIRDESGLVTGWSGDEYGFLHLGFQEYLAAQELRSRVFAQAGDPDAFRAEIAGIADRVGSSWWHEVLCMLLATDEPSLFAPLFDELCARPAFVESQKLVIEMVRDALRFDPAPFLRLLGLPPEKGLWEQRLVAVDLLRTYAEEGLVNANPALLLEVLRREPGRKKKLWGQQLGALRVLEKLGVEVPEGLASHPSEEIASRFRPVVAGTSAVRAGAAISRVAASVTTRNEPSGYELVRISGGTFRMGSPKGERGRFQREGPRHEVVVGDFYLGRYPVTNEEYARFLQDNPKVAEPKYWGDRWYNQPKQPVVGVSWEDAQKYCAWAGLVLPTEAQWEYACRAGTTTRYWSGDAESDLAEVGWYGGNSGGRLHVVGEKPANPFGLHDMHGNVWEWCEDDWSDDYTESQAVHPAAYEEKDARRRVYRGGSWRSGAGFARSAYRDLVEPEARNAILGFRPARVITE